MPISLWPILLFKYVLPLVLILSILGYAGYQVHDNGRQVERVIWQEKVIEEAQIAEAELAMALALVATQAEEHRKQLQELTNAKQEAILALERDVADLSNRGLYIPASSCPDPGSGEATDTGGASKASSRIRLPQAIENNLIQLAADAQRVVIQYEACRTELMEITTIIGGTGPHKTGRRPP